MNLQKIYKCWKMSLRW